MKKQFVILTDCPVRQDQSFLDEESQLWAVCSLPAESFEAALNITRGRQWFPTPNGTTYAIEGEFEWCNGRVCGIKKH